MQPRLASNPHVFEDDLNIVILSSASIVLGFTTPGLCSTGVRSRARQAPC